MSDPSNAILTKILATLGPATNTEETVRRLIEEGVRAFRINFSHGDFDGFDQLLSVIRLTSDKLGIPVGVLGDLCGPKIRLGKLDGGGFDVETGDRVEFTTESIIGHRDSETDVAVLGTNYPPFVQEVDAGQRVLIDDGAVRLLAIDRIDGEDGPRLMCRVTEGGRISNNKGVNLPDSSVSAPSVTDYDRRCLDWAIRRELDYLALSFVRQASDVEDLIALMMDRGRDNVKRFSTTRLPVIAKIETPQAIRDLDRIVEVSDGIMVARGDLGVEMDLPRVPVIQKRIIETCHRLGKPVIVATQMLQSMIEHATPTRAEVSDVANAICDGADAVMLSGETAIGRFPVQAVYIMKHTASITERFVAELPEAYGLRDTNLRGSKYRTASLARAVKVIVEDINPRCVVMWSELGGGARYLAHSRLPVPIIAISSNLQALRQMTLLHGVLPMHMDRPEGTSEFVDAVDKLFMARGWGQQGDPIVFVKGQPIGVPGVTNQLQVHYLGDACRLEDAPGRE
ncbi:pyruvate kinase [Mucisphaera calidilacus]|uniref:Pyruvate kinase n=1 Tax=Mucisphaera calidilacus TaxID=2527982 RepID=A0A518C129_9BACT|nr:pyruvate kinase [Mucisphaera calidilacus]QDU72935.1 Pyruvate kinase [Mucisphaera calidilacus]